MSLNDYVQQLIGSRDDNLKIESEPFFWFVLPFSDEDENNA